MQPMPIYEYACTSCGERTEAKQGFDDPPLQECPHCGGGLRKLFSPVGIVFKGSGFYSTDAKSGKNSGKDAKGDKGDKGDKAPASSSEGATGAKKGDGATKDKSSSDGAASSSPKKSERAG